MTPRIAQQNQHSKTNKHLKFEPTYLQLHKLWFCDCYFIWDVCVHNYVLYVCTLCVYTHICIHLQNRCKYLLLFCIFFFLNEDGSIAFSSFFAKTSIRLLMVHTRRPSAGYFCCFFCNYLRTHFNYAYQIIKRKIKLHKNDTVGLILFAAHSHFNWICFAKFFSLEEMMPCIKRTRYWRMFLWNTCSLIPTGHLRKGCPFMTSWGDLLMLTSCRVASSPCYKASLQTESTKLKPTSTVMDSNYQGCSCRIQDVLKTARYTNLWGSQLGLGCTLTWSRDFRSRLSQQLQWQTLK